MTPEEAEALLDGGDPYDETELLKLEFDGPKEGNKMLENARFERQAAWFNPLRGYSTNDKPYELNNIKFHDGETVYYSVGCGWLDFGGVDKTKYIALEQLRNATKVDLSKRDNFLVKEDKPYSIKNDIPYRTLYVYAPDYEICKDAEVNQGYKELTTETYDTIKISVPEQVLIVGEQHTLVDGKLEQTDEGIIHRVIEAHINYRSEATELGKEVNTLQTQLEAHDIKLDTYVVLRLIENFNVTEKKQEAEKQAEIEAAEGVELTAEENAALDADAEEVYQEQQTNYYKSLGV